MIPEDESVSAWTTLLPPLANRELVYVFPNPWDLDYYGAVGVEDPDPSAIEWIFLRSDSYIKFDGIIDGLIESGERQVAVDDPPFLLLHRRWSRFSSRGRPGPVPRISPSAMLR